MIFGEKIQNFMAKTGKEAADRVRTLAGIMNLKSQIATCEEVIRKNYLEIGRMYYEEHCAEADCGGEARAKADAPYQKQLEAIRNAGKGAEDLRRQMELLKK